MKGHKRQCDSDKPVVTLEQIVEQYQRVRPVSQHTIRQCHVVIRSLAHFCLPECLHDWRLNQLLGWQDWLLNERQVAVATWNNYLSHLRVLVHFAMAEGLIPQSPLKGLHKLPDYDTHPKCISLGDMRRLLAYLASQEGQASFKPAWLWSSAIRLLFQTAIRRAQLAGLAWGDIDFQRDTIHLKMKTSKTKRSWTIPLPPICRNDLLAIQLKAKGVQGRGVLPHEQVFNATLYNERYGGNSLNPTQFSGLFKRLRAKTGIEVSAHRFRHAFGTEAAKRTKNLKIVQKQMGHTTISTTYQYIHPVMDDLRKLGQKLPTL